MKRKKVELIYWLFISLTVLSIPVIYGQAPSRDNFNFVFENDFENDQLGSYLHSDFISDWNLSSSSFLAPQEIINLIIDPDSKYNKVMRGYFPIGTFKIATQGFFWPSPVSPQRTELYLSYDIKFKPGFEWVLGGKIPGLVGGPFVTGRQPGPTDGFSTRPVWKDGGKLASYVYHQDQDITFGNMYYWGSYVGGVWQNFTFTSGKWYNLTIRVVLNTIGSNNGIMEGWINGKLLFKKTNFKFRSLESIKIDYMYIAAFFGGSTTDWAATRDEWIDTDNYVAFTYSSKPTNVPRGFEASSSTRALLHPYYNFSSTTQTALPAAPTSLNSTGQTKSSINLIWKDNSSREQGFKLYRSTTATDGFGEVGTIPANTTTYTDNSLQPSTTYYYRLNAYNADGSSDYTPVLSATTTALQIPATPTGLIASHIDFTLAEVLWTDNANNETGFELERSGPDDLTMKKSISLNSNTVVYTDTGLVMNSTYQYRIRASNTDGNSAWSNVIEVVTPRILPPVAPTELKSIKFTDKSISVSWSDNSANEDAFIIARSLTVEPASTVAIIIGANDTAYTDTSLVSSTTYQYTIKAVNKGGYSSLSNKNVATTLSLAELKRIKEGLVVYYNFGYNPDYIVYDQSGYGEPVNLQVLNRSAILWNDDNTMDILSNTALVSMTPATKIIQAIKRSNELTFECWIKPGEPDFSAGSRIVSLSKNNDEVGFLLDQGLSDDPENQSLNYSIRMQTESTNPSGYPEFIPDHTQPYINLQHLVYVRDSMGMEAMYLNGVKSLEGFRPSDLGTWNDNYYLRLGNESDMTHSWKGSFYSVAFYNKALSFNEIMTNYTAGPCDSIQDDGVTYRVEVYPNPVKDDANLKITPETISDLVPQTSYRILDIYGKVMYQETIFNPNSQYSKQLDFKRYQSGIYILQVTSGRNQKSAKVIVQK